ncbi:MAG: anti-sigma factor [Bacteroidota bacterium]
MNVEDYIASGILESYVNGSLSEAEMKEVDEMAERFPEIQSEIDQIQESLRDYAAANPELPKPPALEEIMAAVKPSVHAMEEERAAAPQAPQFPTKEPSIQSMLPWKKYAWAAAAVLLVGFAAVNIYLLNQVNALKGELAGFQSQVNTLQQTNDYIQQQYVANRQQPVVIEPHNHIVADPASLEVTMTGLDPAPESEIKLYWHTQSHDIYLVIQDLPEPPKDHQYQLWAIIDEVAVDAGVFDHHLKMQKLRNIVGQVSAFRVTLEEKGGSPTPQVERTYASGQVKA